MTAVEERAADRAQAKPKIRFLAYCRTSTETLQDPEESKRWQLARAEGLVAGHGEIVAVVHDVGQSRSIPWRRRPEAVAVLAEAAQPKTRRFDAIVVAEPARAFYGGQFSEVFPILTHHGVDLWVPEVGGRVDPGSEAHDLIMLLFGGMSKGERNRIKMRTRTAMLSQAGEGRLMGGRPGYGYRRVPILDAAGDPVPHPNKGKKPGVFLHCLEPDPATAPVVRRIFEEAARGRTAREIAEALTAEGTPSPSTWDLERNPHRQGTGGAWSQQGVRSILRRPTYTGRVVFGRRKRVERLRNPGDVSDGYAVRMEENPPQDWVFSSSETHEALVSPEVFEKVQGLLRPRRKQPRALAAGRDPYTLRGLAWCDACGRRMTGTMITGHRYLRCRLQTTQYAHNAELERTHPRSAYLREDKVVDAISRWVSEEFSPERVDEAAASLAAAAAEGQPERDAQADMWHRRMVDAEERRDNLVRVAEAGGVAAVLADKINEAEEDRAHAEAQLARLEPAVPTTAEEVRALLLRLGHVVRKLQRADPKLLNEVYATWGLRAGWVPGQNEVRVELAPPLACDDAWESPGPSGPNGRVRHSLRLGPRLGPVILPLAA